MPRKLNFYKIFALLLCVFFSESNSLSSNAKIRGVNNKDILKIIEDQIISVSKYNPSSSDSVSNEFRMANDKETIGVILRSFGYFDAEIKITEKDKKAVFDITMNERYKFNEVLLKYNDNKDFKSGLKVGQVFDLVNIEFDTYATTKQISNASSKIRDFLQGYGFAFAKIDNIELTTDKQNKKIKATYNIILNGQITINKTIVKVKSKENSELLKPFIINRIPWKDGDIYNIKKIEDMKEELMNSGIFSSIDVKLSKPIDDKADKNKSYVEATIEAEEALLHAISVGAKYGTTEKLGLLLSWTHYNIDGKGSKLSTVFDMSNIFDAQEREVSTKIKYSVYDLFRKKQELKHQINYTIDNETSYRVTKFGAETILWQDFGKSFKLGAGICAEDATTTDLIDNPDNLKTRFKSAGIPFGINIDTTDSFLDPQKGIRCSGLAIPYIVGVNHMSTVSGQGSCYFPIQKNSFKNSMVVAFYVRAGSLFYGRDATVPRDRFFFGGGSNSIRGYGYQKIGEMTASQQPYGGKSKFEIGIEPRIRISENVGVVFFAEGGNVFKDDIPNPLKKMLWGYGAGVRYYTPLGPVRLDLALPMKRRKTLDGKRIDSAFQVYVSIGQSF